MISKPKNGWCSFDLGTFHGTPSYVTNVPVDLLDAFIDYKMHGQGLAWFDEEGTEFAFVITPYSLYIIEEKDVPVLHDFSELNIDNLIEEVIADIESDLDEWSWFSVYSDDEKEMYLNRDRIIWSIGHIKSFKEANKLLKN